MSTPAEESKTIPPTKPKNDQPKDNKIDGKKKTKKTKKKMKPIPLHSAWRFWHEKYISKENWPAMAHEAFKVLCEFKTIQEFWTCFNNLPGIEKLETKHGFHLMRLVNEESIKPMWEDPENENGGVWTFRISKRDSKAAWQELVLACIGEQFSEQCGKDDDICGVTVSARPLDYVFQLWHKNSKSPKSKELLTRLQEILGNIELRSPFYRAHKEHSGFQK